MGRAEGEQPRESGDIPKPQTWLAKAWATINSTRHGVVELAAFGAAVVAIAAWFPLAQDNIWPQEKEYRLLADIHAGYSVDNVKSKLGTPVGVRSASTNASLKYILMTFPRDDHLVTILANEAGEVEMYSVLSCNHDFRPHFDLPMGARIALQSQRVGDVQPGDNLTLLSYEFSVNGIVERATEMVSGSGSNALDRMSYLYGANGQCSEALPPRGMTPPVEYNGILRDAPQDIRSARENMTANFYAELAPGFDFSYVVSPPSLPPDDFTWHTENTDHDSYGSISPSPSRHEFPPNFLTKERSPEPELGATSEPVGPLAPELSRRGGLKTTGRTPDTPPQHAKSTPIWLMLPAERPGNASEPLHERPGGRKRP